VDVAIERDIDEPGIAGELRFAGPTVFDGYLNAPELTERAFDDQGYFRSGDVFEIAGDERQLYRFVGRLKDIIIRGGTNISPEEIEALLLAHPKIADASVVGYPDAALGERVCACVVPRPGQTLTLQEVTDYMRDERKVAVFKLPERLELLAELPRNPVGKVLKRKLREQLQGQAAGGKGAARPGL
jgi:acyl-CoA synthetase (AMP-forming)/AMP-acid ligase II